MCLCSPSSEQALHATQWPRVRGLAVSAGVWLRATETEISAALWALVARERFRCDNLISSIICQFESRELNRHST